jgi:hypothetical protein
MTELAMDKRGRGRPHYSRPGGRRYLFLTAGTLFPALLVTVVAQDG